MNESFHFLDYAVVLGYLAVSLGLGFALRRQGGREEFFSASHSMGRITVGLSVMATLFSANSFVMYPSVAYGDSLRIVMALVAFWAMGPIVAGVFIPVYSRLRCQTAYEYLEHRFHVSVRCLASALFIMLRIAWMAAATFAASVAISGISGMNQYVVTIGLGAVAISYTMLGGLRAVMWTDVLQFFVFFGSILFAAVLLISQSNGPGELVQTYFAERKNLLFDFRLDPTIRFGTIAILIGTFLEGLSAFGADQVAVQRYLAARDQRTSQTGFWINLLGLMIVIPGLLVIGTGLFGYFHQNPQDLTPVLVERLEKPPGEGDAQVRHEDVQQRLETYRQQNQAATDESFQESVDRYYKERPRQLHRDVVDLGLSDEAMPRFVRLKFPPGVVGLLVAALMAATMSSIDSGIHSITTAVLVDFRDRLFPGLRPHSDRVEMLVARLMVLGIGILAIVMACFVGQLGNVFAVAKKTVGAFAAPLLAVFVLGLFVPRAKTLGVFLGTWIGAAFTIWIMTRYSDWFSMWFFPIGFGAAFGLSLLFSLLPIGRPSDSSFTYWALRRKL